MRPVTRHAFLDFSVFADESELIGSATIGCRFDNPFCELAVIDLPPFDALALPLHHSPGVHAILVGSGLWRAAGIPTGWEIIVELIRNLAALDKVHEHDDWPQWYREKYGEEPSYSEIIAKSASTSVDGGRSCIATSIRRKVKTFGSRLRRIMRSPDSLPPARCASSSQQILTG
jgi:hypothetical protein